MPRKNTTDALATYLVAAGIAVMLSAFGVSAAMASEVGGTLSSGGTAADSGQTATDNGSGSGASTGSGDMTGTVQGGQDQQVASAAPAPAETPASTSSSRPSKSGTTHSRIAASDTGSMAIQSDGSAAQASDYNGTGGGYDTALDRYLSSVGTAVSNSLSPEDAVAYNGAANPRALESLAAAAGESNSSSTGKAMAVALVGLSVAGLAAYAINSYLAFKRERGF